MDAAGTRPTRSLAKRLVFGSIPLLVLLGGLELVVRGFGLDQTCPNVYQGTGAWACDPILNFKLKPDLMADGRPLNRAGFRSHEFEAKRPGVFRILALGDSCTFGIITTEAQPLAYIAEPYPQALERLAAERIGPGRVEVLNAGIPGYNSFQGVMLLRSKLRGLAPDLITVRYGWNDSFMSAADPSGYREPDSRLTLRIQDLLLHTSLYGFIRRLNLELLALRGHEQPPPLAERPTEWRPNIPIDVYEHNLRRIVELARAQGAAIWLLTSPTAFVTDQNRGHEDSFPKLLLALNALPSFERLVEIHDAYNQATREVGAELGVPVIDMDAAYRAHSAEPLFGAVDVPHPAQAGHRLEAETLHARLVSEGLVRSPAREPRP